MSHKMKDQPTAKLTEGQKAILAVLETRGQATRLDLQEELKHFAHSTIDANLRILKQKGLITVDQVPQVRQKFEQNHAVPVNTYTLAV